MNQQLQPISLIQLRQLEVHWVLRGTIRPNAYNPNRMSTAMRDLLRSSILEDGWTQPIVCLPDGTIVDGEQRWTVAGLFCSSADVRQVLERVQTRQVEGAVISETILGRLAAAAETLAAVQGRESILADITGGKVPVVYLDLRDRAHIIMSTIRHNRARGIHSLAGTQGVLRDLHQMGVGIDEIRERLSFEKDDVERMLASAAQMERQLRDRVAGHTYSASRVPVSVTSLTAEQRRQLGISQSPALDRQYAAGSVDRKSLGRLVFYLRDEEMAQMQNLFGVEAKSFDVLVSAFLLALVAHRDEVETWEQQEGNHVAEVDE